MLYLAQVQKETRFLGLGQTKLKLLACQGVDHRWTALLRDEVISAGEASQFNGGVLVFVQLSASQQVQQIEEAAHSLVQILQNFSHQDAKYQQLEAELAQWRQSEQVQLCLTSQSQELNRREVEIELQWQKLEESFEKLEQQRVEIEQLWQELDLERKELEREWRTPHQPRANDAILN